MQQSPSLVLRSFSASSDLVTVRIVAFTCTSIHACIVHTGLFPPAILFSQNLSSPLILRSRALASYTVIFRNIFNLNILKTGRSNPTDQTVRISVTRLASVQLCSMYFTCIVINTLEEVYLGIGMMDRRGAFGTATKQ